jgi:zinc/manganese transport system permease protein
MHDVIRAIFEPGLFSSSQVELAAAVGAIVAIVAGAVGVFTVIRGQSFAGEALGDLGAAGGSSAYLVGVAPLWGFLVSTIGAAGAMEAIGIQRTRGRDLATGIVLGAGLGLAALFLYLGTTYNATSGATVTVLFGSIFALDSSTLPLVVAFGAVALGAILILYRPLLLTSISPELAAALAAVTIGAILSTALLVGPAASALRLTTRPGRALIVAGALGVSVMWLGLLLSYDSYYWPPLHHGWPVSFFVVTLVLIVYLGSRLVGTRWSRAAEPGRAPAAVAPEAT